jgi:hypothetical protein
MKRLAAYLAAAVALFWAADGRAANDPDEYISGQRPSLHIPVSARRPNSLEKLSARLPLNEFDLSRNRPRGFLRIAEELKYPDSQKISKVRPNSFEKISGSLPERTNTDELARYGLNRQVTISGHRPPSFLKIGSQYPTPGEK